MLLNFREIEVFWAVYQSSSVKEAARLLNVSQPAVSMMLKKAEERFGFRLFERSRGRVRPTAEARALFSATENVFAGLDELGRQLLRIRDGKVGLLRLAATPTLSGVLLHPALSTFRALRPDIRVTVNNVPTVLTHQMVAEGEADVGLAYGPFLDRATETEDLGVAEFACVMRRSHPLAQKPVVTPVDLEGENVMTYRTETPFRRELEKALGRSRISINIAMEGTGLAAAHLAEIGYGIALVDPLVLNEAPFQQLTVRPFKPRTRALVQVVTRREEPVPKVAQEFLVELRKVVPAEFPFGRVALPS